jgi:hypothetical protein
MVRTSVADLRAIAEQMVQAISQLERMMQAIQVAADNPLKRDDGRLTDRSIQAVEAAFAAGARDADVAREFGISPSAASNRRRIWLAAQAKKST